MAALQSPPESPPSTLQPSQSLSNGISHDSVPYAATFSNDLMRIVLQPPSITTGISVIPESLNDLDLCSLPSISAEALPLSLDDPRRIYPSSIPGVNLTHPGGWLEGGAGKVPLSQPRDSPSADAEAYLVRHSIRNRKQLQEQIEQDIAVQMEELRVQMRKREEAVRANEEVEREVERLVEQRKLERKIEERMRKEMQARKKEEG